MEKDWLVFGKVKGDGHCRTEAKEEGSYLLSTVAGKDEGRKRMAMEWGETRRGTQRR